VRTTKKPIVVEICGMPGAGKSTVYHRIKDGVMDVQLGCRVSAFRNILSIVFVVLREFPTFVWLGFDRMFCYRVKKMLYLKVLCRAMRRRGCLSKKVIVFDEGPLFAQTFLLAVGSSFRPKKCLKVWVARNVSDWSGLLNGIIWLDADDSTLVERVRQRNIPHSLKTRTGEEQREFMDGFRSAYDQIISMYERNGIPVLRLTTKNKDIEVTKNGILQFLSEIESGDLPVVPNSEREI